MFGFFFAHRFRNKEQDVTDRRRDVDSMFLPSLHQFVSELKLDFMIVRDVG